VGVDRSDDAITRASRKEAAAEYLESGGLTTPVRLTGQTLSLSSSSASYVFDRWDGELYASPAIAGAVPKVQYDSGQPNRECRSDPWRIRLVCVCVCQAVFYCILLVDLRRFTGSAPSPKEGLHNICLADWVFNSLTLKSRSPGECEKLFNKVLEY
jgi:hypothetical protein